MWHTLFYLAAEYKSPYYPKARGRLSPRLPFFFWVRAKAWFSTESSRREERESGERESGEKVGERERERVLAKPGRQECEGRERKLSPLDERGGTREDALGRVGLFCQGSGLSREIVGRVSSKTIDCPK